MITILNEHLIVIGALGINDDYCYYVNIIGYCYNITYYYHIITD